MELFDLALVGRRARIRNSGDELKQIWKRRKDEEERKERRRRLPSLANGVCMNGGSFKCSLSIWVVVMSEARNEMKVK